MNITELINHPEMMDRDTLYELRSTLALYPYFQTARLLMLQNLFILHDPSFDEELRKASIYIADRKVLFKLVEAAHYSIKRGVRSEERGERSDIRGVRSEERGERRAVRLRSLTTSSTPSPSNPHQRKNVVVNPRQPTPPWTTWHT